jgi:hypothetical protein
MSISRKLTSVVAGVCAVAAIAVLPGSALAEGPVFRFHDSYTAQYSGEECGIAVDAVRSAVSNVMFYEGQGIKVSSSIKTTLTNPDNGKSVVLSIAGNGNGPAPVIDEAAGTITFQSWFNGLWEKIQSSDGSVHVVSAGVLGYEQVFDIETFELISMEPTVQHGQHPSADKSVHCAAISDALL